jgi:hypothetical protein
MLVLPCRAKSTPNINNQFAAGRIGFGCDLAPPPHILRMEKKHPHSNAVYKIVAQTDTTFGVEVAIPDSLPTTVTSFTTLAEAERWITRHREGVASGASLRRRLFDPGES